jgi:hypothetical protein
MKTVVLGTLLASAALCGACGSSSRVVRTDPTSTEGGDLSGYWNDIDAEQVAEAMTDQIVAGGWLEDHYRRADSGERPVVKLMGVIKRTDDRNVNEQYFAKQLERFLLNTRRVRVVAASGQDAINVAERDRQAVHASDATAKSQGNEVGADYTLQTVINSQNETDGAGKAVRAYLVNMELVNVETNEKVWIGEKKIRKVVERASSKW